MNIQIDSNGTKRTAHTPPAPYAAKGSDNTQVKLVLVAVGLVTVLWIGVLIVLGREILARVMT